MASVRSNSVGATTGTSLTITTPSGAADGDVLVAYLAHDSGGAGQTFTASGWTELFFFPEANFGSGLYTRTISGTPPSDYSFTASSGTGDFKGIIVCLNPDGDTFVEILEERSAMLATQSVSTPTIAGVANPSILLTFWANDSSFTITSPPADMTAQGSSTTSSMSVYGYSQINAGTGTLSKSVTWSSTDQNANCIAVAEFAAASTVKWFPRRTVFHAPGAR